MIACVFTLGCKLNEVESASLAQGLKERGYDVIFYPAYADLYILNTCAVTKEAERKSRQAVTRLKRYNPAAKFIVCGCASQHNPQAFSKNDALVFGTAHKGDILANLAESGVFLGTEEAFSPMPMPARVGTRAFLRVQDGCNRFCSYCLIPYLRGRSRSRNAEDIVIEAKACDAKEIVLTGIDLSSYRDGETDLCGLVEKLKDVPARFRFGSLEAGVIDERLLETMRAAGNFAEHFHLSLQSGSNAVLRVMNRKYTREEFFEKCALIYKYFTDAAITTDVIVGFPTETEEDFMQTVDLVEKVGFSRVHIFPYSPREGTNAAKLPDLPAEVKHDRADRLRRVAVAVAGKYVERFLGREQEVLFEDLGGYTRNYIRVYAEGAREGALCRVKLTRPFGDGAKGEVIEEI